MRHDVRLLYLTGDARCPAGVSVRLPTGSCRRGCFFCCSAGWFGKRRWGLKYKLSEQDFVRLWEQIIFKNDFKFVWPQGKILQALKKNRMLRFVREDLFETEIEELSSLVLEGCRRRGYGIIVKTSSVNVVKFIPALQKIRNCVVFSVTNLLSDYGEKINAVEKCVRAGLKVTVALAPIYEDSPAMKKIIAALPSGILGVLLGWLHGSPELFPAGVLRRQGYKYVRGENQYNQEHLKVTKESICGRLQRRGLPVRFYFGSQFYRGGACCFLDMV